MDRISIQMKHRDQHEYERVELLELMIDERATQLDLACGAVPVVWIHGMDHLVQGPPISRGNVAQLLRSMSEAATLQDSWNRDSHTFVFRFSETAWFDVEQRREPGGDRINLSIRPAIG